MAGSETPWLLRTRCALTRAIVQRICNPDEYWSLKCGSGHESAGEVVEVGEGVTQWKAGRDTHMLTLSFTVYLPQKVIVLPSRQVSHALSPPAIAAVLEDTTPVSLATHSEELL